ncbi:hypothetical protein [Gluconobacter morbifer]|uniref:hypothetical protein n=1 Tax=Gluconobacter morbifer TaxID=479935 RepID=UPI00031C74CC|nr:hypothetical protein [Gluconobacter morbifer]
MRAVAMMGQPKTAGTHSAPSPGVWQWPVRPSGQCGGQGMPIGKKPAMRATRPADMTGLRNATGVTVHRNAEGG